jgi:hypothetical protein
MKVDLTELNKRVEQKLITKRPHPTADLFIYNYTPKVQYSRAWDEYTMMCRGLILDGEGNVKAKPFPKFFNLEEYQEALPAVPFQVFDKLDGSLGILYWVDGIPAIATRGSFTSDQAIKGTEILNRKILSHGMFDRELTYLYEIIYPENRIVVDYGNNEELVLLAAIHTDSGDEVPITGVFQQFSNPFASVKSYDGIKDIHKLKELSKENAEGFVIRFESGLRLKLKFDEYVRLHKLLTQVSSYSIWELLKNNQPFDELLENVPDEYYEWVKQTTNSITEAYDEIDKTCSKIYGTMPQFDTRREAAEYVLKTPYPSIIFSMMDKKDYEHIIWKLVKPQYSQPFRSDIDG